MSNKNPHAVALGKLGGKAKSTAKVEAARLNGRKGGRPKKFNQTETVKKLKEKLFVHDETDTTKS